ncbi:hypothetical protein L7F22_037252 [Adiantum nelumboides]|nr:hypothetical protein [Adiantum nelumboides]
MLKSVNDALNSSKPFTSVSVLIDRLSANSYGEDDLDGIPELVEAINIQYTGPSEASRQLRKKLKYGSIHGQKRAITMLGALCENAGPRFQSSFADERLVERIKVMSQDPLVDASVRKKLMRMLLVWKHLYSKEPTMRIPAGLYSACGGGRKSDAQMKSEAAEAYRKRKQLEDRDRQVRMDRKAAERMQKEEDARRAKDSKKKGGGRTTFDFEKEKPIILSTLATSQQSATSLVNALQHVNREKESISENQRVQLFLSRVKAERKKVVRYIQLVKDEEFLGGLISANDQILLSLELYDKLAKPTDRDSDEEDGEPLANIRGSKSAAQKAQERAEQEEAEIAIVQQRLAAAHIEEGELDALQDKQRQRIERYNSFRQPSRGASTSSSKGTGHINDLMDLNFDDDEGEGRPPHAVMRPTSTAAGSSAQGSSAHQQNSTLSDYSDYESESDEEVAAIASTGLEGRAGSTNVKPNSAAAYDDDDLYSNHQPSIGPESILDYDLEGGEDDDDPFADPQEAQHTGGSIGFQRHQGPRQGFAAV